MLNLEYIPSFEAENINKEKYIKISFTKLSSLGAMFSHLSKISRTITQSINTTDLYRAKLPDGTCKLNSAKDGLDLLGLAYSAAKILVDHKIKYHSI